MQDLYTKQRNELFTRELEFQGFTLDEIQFLKDHFGALHGNIFKRKNGQFQVYRDGVNFELFETIEEAVRKYDEWS